MFFFITVLVGLSAARGQQAQLLDLQRAVVQTNEDLVNLGRAQVCMAGTSLEDRNPGTTNWCLVENGQLPLYSGVAPVPPPGVVP